MRCINTVVSWCSKALHYGPFKVFRGLVQDSKAPPRPTLPRFDFGENLALAALSSEKSGCVRRAAGNRSWFTEKICKSYNRDSRHGLFQIDSTRTGLMQCLSGVNTLQLLSISRMMTTQCNNAEKDGNRHYDVCFYISSECDSVFRGSTFRLHRWRQCFLERRGLPLPGPGALVGAFRVAKAVEKRPLRLELLEVPFWVSKSGGGFEQTSIYCNETQYLHYWNAQQTAVYLAIETSSGSPCRGPLSALCDLYIYVSIPVPIPVHLNTYIPPYLYASIPVCK